LIEVKLQAVRGMNDILPQESSLWQRLEQVLRQVVACYGYEEIRLPIVESTALFKRSIGEVTDIVEKEMYTFDDRNGDSLTLRPEGTAGCVRALIEHSQLQQRPQQRLWYLGPMFRHERPQRGRYRQFYQFGVEAFGMPGPDVDVEQICLMHRVWQQLGLSAMVELEINSLGTAACRARHRDALMHYLQQHQAQLDADSQRRLNTNPLRILDSKNPEMATLIADAPRLLEFLDAESLQHFAELKQRLESLGIAYRVNPRLVRGLDYYGLTVYEWVTTSLGAQGTVCAGGRYDSLVQQLGGIASPAVGFAMGLERVILMLQQQDWQAPAPDCYLVAVGDSQVQQAAMQLAERMRDYSPSIKVVVNAGGGNFKAQFKRADRSGAKVALVIGESEWQQGLVAIKNLRSEAEQQLHSIDEIERLCAIIQQ